MSDSDDVQDAVVVSVAAAAGMLGIPERDVRHRIAGGEFPTVMVDGRLMVPIPGLHRWAAATGGSHRTAITSHPPRTAATMPPCPACGTPLIADPRHRSRHHGNVARCAHSFAYFAFNGHRIIRVTDLITPPPPTPL